MKIVEKSKKLKKYIKRSKNIFLMGHKNLDLDALGSSIGMYVILQHQKKNCYLVIDDTTHELGVEKILKELDGCINVIKSSDVEKCMHKNNKKNLLLVLDTNKKDLVQSDKILKLFSKKVVLDHHKVGKTTINDAFLIVDEEVSSTCEMVTNLLETYDIEIDSYYATVLLSGIVLDTNNFMLKTTSNTYYSAYYLASLGASAKKVQYLLKQDLNEYTEREKLLSRIEILPDKIAFSKATPYITYRREDLAKIADTLLFFNDIEASFVIGKIGKDKVGISGRSLGNYDVSSILSPLGGGGDTCEGAAAFEKKSISAVEKLLKEEIKKQEGE